MKTFEQKAEELTSKILATMDDEYGLFEIQAIITTALKEQDRDTRHAIAEAIPERLRNCGVRVIGYAQGVAMDTRGG